MPRRPEDPIVRELVQHARRHAVSRRAVLQGAGIGAATLALAACAAPGTKKLTPAKDVSSSDKTMTWANWALYLDEDDAKKHPTLEAFTKATGIQVDYRVDVDDNNSYFAKVKDQLQAGRDIGADTVCLTDWMVSRLIRLGYTQTLDRSKMPNTKNLLAALENVDYDKGRKHSMPWQGGFAGIAWNSEKVDGELKSVDDLWKPELKGKVGVLAEMRDTIGLIMLQQGVDISGKWGESEFKNALDVFKKQVKDGQIRNVKGNSYIDDLTSGDTLAAIVWSGDIATLNEQQSGKFKFAIPEAGGTLWYDNFVLPMGSSKKGNVEQLINWYYDPKIAAEVAAYVSYVTPVDGAKDAAVDIDPELADNQLIFPDAATLATVKQFRTLTPEEDQAFGTEFQSVLLGGS